MVLHCRPIDNLDFQLSCKNRTRYVFTKQIYLAARRNSEVFNISKKWTLQLTAFQVGIATELPSGTTSNTNLSYNDLFAFLECKGEAYETIPHQRYATAGYVMIYVSTHMLNYLVY